MDTFSRITDYRTLICGDVLAIDVERPTLIGTLYLLAEYQKCLR